MKWLFAGRIGVEVNRTGFLLAAYLMTRCDVPGWRDADALEVRTSGCQAVRLSGCQAVRLSGCQAVRLSGCQAVRLSGAWWD